MKMRVFLILLSLLMVLPSWGSDDGSGTGAGGNRRPDYAPGELLVKYKPANRTASSAKFERRWGVSTLRAFRDIGVHHVKLPIGMTVERAMELYRQDPDVEYAEPNYYRHVTLIPNDTDFALLWGLIKIAAPAAWDRATDCTQVTVAVIDTGADYLHPDLTGNIASGGYDFVDDDNDPMDANGHGTYVAGTIGAVGNNNVGVTGICWTASLMILRAFDAFGYATTDKIISAMAYARTNGAKIINASYTGSGFSQAESEEISNLNTAGILLIAAAGNEAADNDVVPSYPASYGLPNIIAVAATDEPDHLAPFSNYGRNSVHVAAPGTDIYGTQPGRQTVFSDNFDDGNIVDWTVDAPWGVSTNGYGGTGYSLSESPGGAYANNVNVSARPTNPIDLSGRTGTKLTFILKGASLGGDLLYVETSVDAVSWVNRPVLVVDAAYNETIFENGISGTTRDWVDATADFGLLDGKSTAYFRFRFRSNGTGTADGFQIDDVVLSAAGVQNVYQFVGGTSISAPHVTGLAALVQAHTLALTHLQVKARLLNCVDRVGDLADKVSTRGRINASNSLENLPAPPVSLSAEAASSTQINLSWSNTYFDPIGFKIERKQGGIGTFIEIADLTTNVASYSDTGLNQSTSYTYRVRAYTDSHLSDYSAEMTATTPAASSAGDGGGGCFIGAAAHGFGFAD
jgi:subtilisin family serine protease